MPNKFKNGKGQKNNIPVESTDQDEIYRFGEDDSSFDNENINEDNEVEEIKVYDYTGGLFDGKFSEGIIRKSASKKPKHETFRGQREMYSNSLAKKISEEVLFFIYL